MRITIPVSGDGDAWMSHLPEIRFDPESVLDASGRLNLPKVSALFRDANAFCESRGFRKSFLISSEDGYNVLSMTVEFLRQLSAVSRYLESRPESNAHLSSDDSPSDRRLERRMNRDQVAFCRLDVRDCATGVKFVVGHANPNEKVIGNCADGAREFALYALRVLLHMADSVNALSRDRNAGLRVSVEAREPGLVEEARRRERRGVELDKIRAANEKRKSCPNNRNGFCSPCCPSCRCYNQGRCAEASLKDESQI